MFCKYCGKQIDDNAVICPHCGVQVGVYRTGGKNNTLAIIGFILSFFVPVAGLICSIIARKQCREGRADGESFALAGIIISAVELALAVIVIVLSIVYLVIVLPLIIESEFTTLAFIM